MPCCRYCVLGHEKTPDVATVRAPEIYGNPRARATRASCSYFPAAKNTVAPELPTPAIAAELAGTVFEIPFRHFEFQKFQKFQRAQFEISEKSHRPILEYFSRAVAEGDCLVLWL
jgi:hypothetical protein